VARRRHWYEKLGLSADPFAAPPAEPWWDVERARVLGEVLREAAGAAPVIAVVAPAGAGKSVVRRAAAAHRATSALCLELDGHVFLERAELVARLREAFASARDQTVPEKTTLRDLATAMAACIRDGEKLSILVDDADELPDESLDALMSLAASLARRPLRIALFGREPLADRLRNHPRAKHVQLETLPAVARDQLEAYLAARLAPFAPEGRIPRFVDVELDDIARRSRGLPGRIDALALEILRSRVRGRPRSRPRRRARRHRLQHWLRRLRRRLGRLVLGSGVALLALWWALAPSPAPDSRTAQRPAAVEAPSDDPPPASTAQEPDRSAARAIGVGAAESEIRTVTRRPAPSPTAPVGGEPVARAPDEARSPEASAPSPTPRPASEPTARTVSDEARDPSPAPGAGAESTASAEPTPPVNERPLGPEDDRDIAPPGESPEPPTAVAEARSPPVATPSVDVLQRAGDDPEPRPTSGTPASPIAGGAPAEAGGEAPLGIPVAGAPSSDAPRDRAATAQPPDDDVPGEAPSDEAEETSDPESSGPSLLQQFFAFLGAPTASQAASSDPETPQPEPARAETRAARGDAPGPEVAASNDALDSAVASSDGAPGIASPGADEPEQPEDRTNGAADPQSTALADGAPVDDETATEAEAFDTAGIDTGSGDGPANARTGTPTPRESPPEPTETRATGTRTVTAEPAPAAGEEPPSPTVASRSSGVEASAAPDPTAGRAPETIPPARGASGSLDLSLPDGLRTGEGTATLSTAMALRTALRPPGVTDGVAFGLADTRRGSSAGTVAGEREILAMRDDDLVLQVMVLSSETRVAVWLAEQRGLGDFAIYRRGAQDGAWVILQGPFRDRPAAASAARVMETQAGVLNPWIRRVAEVHEEILGR
jgi:type II secretory pathway predicted ATPase ExeA